MRRETLLSVLIIGGEAADTYLKEYRSFPNSANSQMHLLSTAIAGNASSGGRRETWGWWERENKIHSMGKSEFIVMSTRYTVYSRIII